MGKKLGRRGRDGVRSLAFSRVSVIPKSPISHVAQHGILVDG